MLKKRLMFGIMAVILLITGPPAIAAELVMLDIGYAQVTDQISPDIVKASGKMVILNVQPTTDDPVYLSYDTEWRILPKESGDTPVLIAQFEQGAMYSSLIVRSRASPG